jgi:uncharacterized protein (TIGR03083 family)
MAGAGSDFVREREALRADLARLGPDAPTTVAGWTTEDLAVHVVIGELSAAVPNTPFRWLVGRGVRLDRMAPLNARALSSQRRRHGFDWAMERLGRRPPRLHTVGVVAAVSLLEMWAHHEDVLAANDVGPCSSGVDLAPVLRVLTRYQRRALRRHGVRVGQWHEPDGPAKAEVDGDPADLARWLSGRGDLSALSVTGDADDVAALAAELMRI